MGNQGDYTVNAKPWYRSKTVWVNALAAALVALESQLHILEPVMPVSAYVALAMLLPAINIVLRSVTSSAITLRGGSG